MFHLTQASVPVWCCCEEMWTQCLVHIWFGPHLGFGFCCCCFLKKRFILNFSRELFLCLKLYIGINGASLAAQMVKSPPEMQETRFDPWVGKIPWRRKWKPTPVFLPGEFYGQYSPWDRKESNTTEQLTLSLSAKI